MLAGGTLGSSPMHTPPLRGRCKWRALFAWKLDPVVARRLVPAPLRPKLVQGHALAAVDTMGLQGLRPRMVPGPLGLSLGLCSHLIAAEWKDGQRYRDVLYVIRRDVDVHVLGRAGGLLLPGKSHGARIQSNEGLSDISIACHSLDGECQLDLAGHIGARWSSQALFASPAAMMEVLGNRSGGRVAYDEAGKGTLIELEAKPECAEPLTLDRAHSSLFDGGLVPEGSAELEAGVLLRNLVCVWRSQGRFATRPANGEGETATEGLREPSPA